MTDLVVHQLAGAVQTWSGDPELDRHVRDWLVAKAGRSPHTWRAYERTIIEWLAHCTQAGIDPLAPSKVDVERWHRVAAVVPAQRTGKPLARTTLANKVSVIASFYDFLVDEDVLDAVPVRKSTRPKAPSESTTVGVSVAELLALLQRLDQLLAMPGVAPQEYRQILLERAVLATLFLQGLRVEEELLQLRVDRLRFNAGVPTMVVRGKGDRIREIAVDERAGAAIGALVDDRYGPEPDPQALIFVTAAGSPPSRMQVDRMLKRHTRAAGIASWRSLSSHSARHACATHLLDAGVALHVVQDFLGHASAATTERYDRARGSLRRSTAAVHQRARYLQQAGDPPAG
jgi:integrase/recombinase XerD